jgi:hypothetical protein
MAAMGDRMKAWRKYFTVIIVILIIQAIISLLLFSWEIFIGLTVAEVALFLFCTVLEGIFETEVDLLQDAFDDRIEQHKFQAGRTGVSTDESRTLTCPHCSGTGYYAPSDINELERITCRYCKEAFDYLSDPSKGH